VWRCSKFFGFAIEKYSIVTILLTAGIQRQACFPKENGEYYE